MDNTTKRALVVDDEPSVRKLLILSLQKYGFECDEANDGVEAALLLDANSYDAVITDLRMPNKHGHALAVDILKMECRPLLVVYTGVIETKIAKDLLARGVDDILFKPVDFGFLAAKINYLVARRLEQAARCSNSQLSEHDEPHTSLDSPVSLSQLERKLAGMSRLLPISHAAIEVYNLTGSPDADLKQIARAIERDGALVAEVLRLANSSFYNLAGGKIVSLEAAIVRIGQKRVGELAIATSSLSALTPGLLPWLDIDLTSQRSRAAGLALELLIEAGEHRQLRRGLLVSAALFPFGRIILGTLFPQLYEALTEACRQSGQSLQEHERRVFPLTHTEVLSQVLSTWGVPTEVTLPMKLAMDDFASLASISEPIRTRVELVKLAIFIGRLAAGQWEDWDLVQFPPASVLRRLRINDLPGIVGQVRSRVETLPHVNPNSAAKPQELSNVNLKPVNYCNLRSEGADTLPLFMQSMGFRAVKRSLEWVTGGNQAALVNCYGTHPMRFAAQHGNNPNLVVLCAADQQEAYARIAHTVTLPTSYRRLRDAVNAASGPQTRKSARLMGASA